MRNNKIIIQRRANEPTEELLNRIKAEKVNSK
jgi:hypothetical protein